MSKRHFLADSLSTSYC